MSEVENQETQLEGTELEEALDKATEAVAIQAKELDELDAEGESSGAVDFGSLLDVPVQITIEVGRTRMCLGELVRLAPGSLIELDREAHEPADVLVNGKVVARGEIVTIENNYGVRITQVES